MDIMRILIIEDDMKLAKVMANYLDRNGFLCDNCQNGLDGLDFAQQPIYDLIILDRLLPNIDGLSILKTLREKNITTPVIMVTALNELSDRIDGFDYGADDYLGKPFAMEELLARTKALLRRPAKIDDISLLTYSNIKIDITNKILSSDTSQCELTKKEAALMVLFIQHKEQTLTRDVIMNKVWGPESYVGEANIDNFISFLRRRLKSVNALCKITTIHSVGFRLEISL